MNVKIRIGFENKIGAFRRFFHEKIEQHAATLSDYKLLQCLEFSFEMRPLSK